MRAPTEILKKYKKNGLYVGLRYGSYNHLRIGSLDYRI